MDAKARETEIVDDAQALILIDEQVRIVADAGRLAGGHLEQVDARPVEEAARQELDLKAEILAAPEGPLLVEADAAILIEVEMIDGFGQPRIRRLVGVPGHLLGEMANAGAVERSRGRAGLRLCGARSGGGAQPDSKGGMHQFASLQQSQAAPFPRRIQCRVMLCPTAVAFSRRAIKPPTIPLSRAARRGCERTALPLTLLPCRHPNPPRRPAPSSPCTAFSGPR